MLSLVGVITRDRPRCLARSLSSIAESSKKYGLADRVVVVDASTQESNRLENARIANSGCGGRHVEYVGPRQQGQKLAELRRAFGASEGDALDAVFSVHEGSAMAPGVSRNWLLAYSYRQRCLSVDDDVYLRVAESVEVRKQEEKQDRASRQIRFVADEPGREIGPCPTRRDALNIPAAQRGVRDAIEPLLGCHTRDLFSERDQVEASVAGRVDPFIKTLMSPHTTVGVVSLGIYGDPGFGHPMAYCMRDGHERQRLMDDDDVYLSALRERAGSFAVSQTAIHDSPALMAGAFAFDHRRPLPPFFGHGRNEDGYWGALLWRLFPYRVMADHSICVAHDPPTARSFTTEDFEQAIPDVCDLLLMSVVIMMGDSTADESSLARYARTLVSLGNASLRDFRRVITDWAHRLTRWRLQRATALLEKYNGQPPAWADHMRRLQGAFERVLAQDYTEPPQFMAGASAEDRLETLQELVHSYGRAILIWPKVLEVFGECVTRTPC